MIVIDCLLLWSLHVVAFWLQTIAVVAHEGGRHDAGFAVTARAAVANQFLSAVALPLVWLTPTPTTSWWWLVVQVPAAVVVFDGARYYAHRTLHRCDSHYHRRRHTMPQTAAAGLAVHFVDHLALNVMPAVLSIVPLPRTAALVGVVLLSMAAVNGGNEAHQRKHSVNYGVWLFDWIHGTSSSSSSDSSSIAATSSRVRNPS